MVFSVVSKLAEDLDALRSSCLDAQVAAVGLIGRYRLYFADMLVSALLDGAVYVRLDSTENCHSHIGSSDGVSRLAG